MGIWDDQYEHMRWWTRAYDWVYGDGDLVYGHQMNTYMNLEVMKSYQHLSTQVDEHFGSHNCKLSIDERTNGTFMHFWWMFFSSSLAKMKWAEVETYMIIFGFVLFSGLARWKAFSIKILIGLVKGSNQNWPFVDQNWLPRRFGSKSVKSKVAVCEKLCFLT